MTEVLLLSCVFVYMVEPPKVLSIRKTRFRKRYLTFCLVRAQKVAVRSFATSCSVRLGLRFGLRVRFGSSYGDEYHFGITPKTNLAVSLARRTQTILVSTFELESFRGCLGLCHPYHVL